MATATGVRTHEQETGGTKARRRRRLRRIALGVGIALVVAYAGVGWYISGEILSALEVKSTETTYDVDVVVVDADSITLVVPDSDEAVENLDAVMGLRWEGGYAQVGPGEATPTGETRPFHLIEGSLPPVGADVASFDGFAFPGDPTVLGLAFESVTYSGPNGDLDAWFVPGEGSRWIIAVHGLGSPKREFLRMLDSLRALAMPTLVISYRNDPGAPPGSGSLILAGQREWRDVAAAVDYALSEGADDVVLYATSMGGAVALSYMLEQPDAPVVGAVLEAPNADMRQVVSLRSGEALPVGGPIGGSLLAMGRLITWMRTGLDFDTVDYVDRAGDLSVPILLFHGKDDDSVPFPVGEALARARPDLVEFHPLDGAGHVKAWNEGPEEYRQIVTDFLRRLDDA